MDKAGRVSVEAVPSFSEGWQSGFKKRHGIKAWYLHGKRGSFSEEEAGVDLEKLRQEVYLTMLTTFTTWTKLAYSQR